MNLHIVIRHETANGKVKNFIEHELTLLNDKFDFISAEVIIDQEGPNGHVKTAEVNLKVPQAVLHTKEASEEVYKSIDLALKTIEKQLKKHRETHFQRIDPKMINELKANGK
jgi:ribosomal subunit interface protein